MCDKSKKTEILRSTFKIILMVFILVVAITCLIGLAASIWSFVENQQSFNDAYSNAAAAIVDASPQKKDFINMSIEHLEKLQQIQKNAASNDVMSFLYSTLSTILVALCAGFVAKSYNNVEKAKESAENAKVIAQESNKSAENAKQDAETSNQCAQDSKKSLEKAFEISEELKAELKAAKALYENAKKEIKKQRDTIQTLTIHMEIIHARSAMISHDKTNTNQRIFNILSRIESLEPNIEKGIILQLQQELLCLETDVECFKEYANSLPDSNSKISMLTAIDRYEKSLTDAVERCKTLC